MINQKPVAINQKCKITKFDNFAQITGKTVHRFADISELKKKPRTEYDDLDPNLITWAEHYLEYILDKKKEKTFQAIRNDLENFIEFFIKYNNSIDLRKWNIRTSMRFVEHLDQIGRKPVTIKRNLVSIRTFGKWILTKRPDYLPDGDPTDTVKAPSQDPLRPKGLTPKQSKKFMDQANLYILKSYKIGDGSKPLSGDEVNWQHVCLNDSQRPIRDYSIIMLLLNGGLRRAEVCALNLDQVDEKHLRDVKCKGNLRRDILISETTRVAIRNYLISERPVDAKNFPDSKAVFLPSALRSHKTKTDRISERSINAIVNKIAKDAGIGHVHPHMFRHTHAYNLLEEDKSLPYIQKRLGHQTMDMLVLYTQKPEADEEELINKVEIK